MPSEEPAEGGKGPEAASAPDAAEVRRAGRGGIAIAIAKVSFILFGFAQQLILPYLVGVDGYGELRRVFGIVGIVNNVVVGAAIQGVSRTVSSARPGEAPEAFRRALSIHVVLAVVLSLGFAALAGAIADAVSAPHIVLPLRVVGAVVLLYGIYAPLVGALNGSRRFLDQAGLDIGYGAVRLVATAGGALLLLRAGGSGVVGASVGFASAALLIVPVAAWRAGTGRAGAAGPRPREYLAFLGPLALGQVFLNLLIQTDFLLLSRFAGQAAGRLGFAHEAADRLVGAYGGVQLFALLPYQMLISISFVLFPMLARASAENDRPAVARYTEGGVRVAFVIAGLMCGTLSALGPSVLRFAFPPAIAELGGPALRIHALGMGAFAILGIASTALTSLHRERISALLTALAVALIAAGCFLLVPGAPFGPAMLVRSALATSIALTTVAFIAALVLRKVAGAFVPPLTLLRVLLATAITIAVGYRLPYLGKVIVLGEVAFVAVVYVAVLLLTREIGGNDLARLRQVVRKKA